MNTQLIGAMVLDAFDPEPFPWCADRGHALYTIDGELQTECLRCGIELDGDAIAAAFDRDAELHA